MEVVVFGAGSLGSLLGGLLAQDHPVTLVGREPHIDAINRRGLRVTGAIEAVVHPRAVTALDRAHADLAVVAVKAYNTPHAATALSDADLGAVLSVQNGMGNEDHLAAEVPCPVFAGTATYGALLQAPGVVECTGLGTITMGPHADGSLDHAHELAAGLRAAGVDTDVLPDMTPPLWEKLAVNTGINPVTALTRADNGAILDSPASAIATNAVLETAAAARDAGVNLTDDVARARLESVAEATAGNTSSMRRDLERGRRTEIDAINGYVVDRAGNTAPINSALTALIQTWEATHGLR